MLLFFSSFSLFVTELLSKNYAVLEGDMVMSVSDLFFFSK